MKACNCGDDEVFDVPEGHLVMGIFGLTKTDKNTYDYKPIRDLDNIRGLGFITMQIRH